MPASTTDQLICRQRLPRRWIVTSGRRSPMHWRGMEETAAGRARLTWLRLMLYLLPGAAAALGVLASISTADHLSVRAAVLNGTLIVVGFTSPPLIDALRLRHARKHKELQARQAQAEEDLTRLREHFQPRGQGILPSSPRAGWYFTGRAAVLRELVVWLSEPSASDYRMRVVTGAPGSGKSAVLGRIVCFADPRLAGRVPLSERARAAPETIAGVGTVRLALHARGSTVDEIAARIATAMGVNESTAAGLLAAL